MSNGFKVESGIVHGWNEHDVIESSVEFDYFHANAKLHDFVRKLPVLVSYKASRLLFDKYSQYFTPPEWTVRIVDETTRDTVAERFYTGELEERIGF